MKLLLVALSALVVAVCAEDCETKCKKCPVLERSECLAGVDKDSECECCDVCSRYESQKCDLRNAPFKYGKCGDGLECRETVGGNICQCLWEEIICGTDGITYGNLCGLMASAVRQGKKLVEQLEVKSVGPCNQGALITSKPQYVKNTTNNNVVLSCEASGFPAPKIYWNVTRANSKTITLPGDDNHILTATRGGPNRYQVTGWVQIEGLLKRHEGDYTCVAINEHHEDWAKARIKVIDDEE